MSKLKDHLACIGILLGIGLGDICLAQNVSFPQDVTIRRSNAGNINQYLVYVSNPEDLVRIKTVVPEAFINSVDSGQKIVQIGRFNNLDFAQKRVIELRRLGIEAKVQESPVVTTAKIPTAKVPTDYPSSIPVTPANSSAVVLPDVPYAPTPNGANSLIPPAPNLTILPAPPSVAELGVRQSGNRYFVIIPSTVDTVLVKVRSIVPTAKLTSSDRGTYIEVQGYPDRPSAETLNATMRSQGLDSRVIYF
jgi:hypothetical protein